jgi:glycosyltransferase involved in cell wall biosynthesis
MVLADLPSLESCAKMKIVCIAASFVPSTTANSIQVVKAAHALAVLGHDVILIVPGEKSVPWEALKDLYGLQVPFEVRWLRENLAFRRYDFAFKAAALSRKLAPTLVYTWMLQAAVLLLWRRMPVILELHDRVTGSFGPWLFRRFWQSAVPHRLLTNTDALWRVLQKTYHLTEEAGMVQIAPNGVELDRFQNQPSAEAARETLALPSQFTAGYTGHFYAGRGMNLMYALAKTCPEIHFLWVGGQPADVLHWQNQIKAQGLGNITLTGFVDNAVLPQYQAAADVLLMPYGQEIAGSGGGNSADICSPMKMFEYMAAGRAIITSDLPVIHEVLDPSMAVFCPPGDLAAWKKAVVDLAADPQRRLALARAAQEAVQAYTWKRRAARALAGFVGKN